MALPLSLDKHKLLEPNNAIAPSAFYTLGAFWVGMLLVVWYMSGSVVFPNPLDVIAAFPKLWSEEGLGEQLWVSFNLNIEAAILMGLFSLLIAYATVVPFFRPLGVLVSSGRFNGFVGMPLVFLAMFHNPHTVKIALLVFGAGVFTVLSVVQLVESIPKEQFDHCRTLRMSEWHVVWEVIILGKFDEVIDILRVNVAMMWMMLPMVEGLFRFEGGVGAMMLDQSKHFDLAAVFCSLFLILAVGLIQDYCIGVFKNMLCPYAAIGLQR